MVKASVDSFFIELSTAICFMSVLLARAKIFMIYILSLICVGPLSLAIKSLNSRSGCAVAVMMGPKKIEREREERGCGRRGVGGSSWLIMYDLKKAAHVL